MDGMEFLAHGILGRPVAQLIQTQVLHQAVRRSPTARQPVAVLELAVLALLSVQGLERGCSRSRVTRQLWASLPSARSLRSAYERSILMTERRFLTVARAAIDPFRFPGCPLHQSL